MWCWSLRGIGLYCQRDWFLLALLEAFHLFIQGKFLKICQIFPFAITYRSFHDFFPFKGMDKCDMLIHIKMEIKALRKYLPKKWQTDPLQKVETVSWDRRRSGGSPGSPKKIFVVAKGVYFRRIERTYSPLHVAENFLTPIENHWLPDKECLP